MLDAVIRAALRYRLVVVALSLALLVYGGYLSTTLPIDVFPDLDRPRVVIMTECGPMAADDVESQVTFPIEAAMLGSTGVQTVRSQSAAGLSIVYVEFDWGADLRGARQTVQERLSAVLPDLPPEIRPQLAPTSSLMGQILVIGLYSRPGPGGGELAPLLGTDLVAERRGESRLTLWRVTDRRQQEQWQAVAAEVTWLPREADGTEPARLNVAGRQYRVNFPTPQRRALELRTLADWSVRPRLMKVPGTAQVMVMGGGRKQFQVIVDPAALLAYEVSLHQVETALRDNNINASGGFLERGEAETAIRVLGRLGPRADQVVADLRKVPVKVTPQRTILLEQVARIVEGPQLKRGDATVNGRPGVLLTLTKQPHADTRHLTTEALATLAEVEPSLPPDVALATDLFQQRRFIDRGLANVGEALLIGAGLVLVILFLFLLNFRTTFISLLAIPLSLVVTTLVFKLVGRLTDVELSINVMTLGGLAVAMGELVDDAIVDVENIFRRLRENAASAQPRSPLKVVAAASIEVRSAIAFGTAVVILVFLPLFALSGIEGRLFTPLGIAYIVSILSSLAVSLTVTPVLSYYLLTRSEAARAHGDGLLLRVLKWAAGYLVRFSMRFAAPLLVLTWLAVAASAWLLTTIGADFLPPFDEGAAQVNVTLPSGSSLEASNRTGAIVDAKLASMQRSSANPNGAVLSFSRRTGRAELEEHADPPNVSEYLVTINPECGRPREEVLKQLLGELREEVPGIDLEVEQPLAHLISEQLSGVTAQIAIKLYGDDIDMLARTAQRIKSVVATVPGVTPPVVEPLRQVEEIHIRLRADDLAFHGLNRAEVAEFVQTALRGQVVSQVLEGQRRFDLVVRLEEAYRIDPEQIGRLQIDLPGRHEQVMLSEVADIDTGLGPNQIRHDNARRRIVIRCNVSGRDLRGAVTDIQERVRNEVRLPEGFFIEYGGQFESQRRATWLIAGLAVLALAGMFLVLLLLYPSARIALQILNAIPTAFIGGVLALVLTGQTLTVASMVGFISLGGIAARNGILLVTHYFHLMRHEGEGFTRQMVLRGSLERLAPVLMTALTAGIGLVPLVIGGHRPGREILYPVATVIFGGLITSTFCEFLIHPGLFWRFSGRDTEWLLRDNDDRNDPADANHA